MKYITHIAMVVCVLVALLPLPTPSEAATIVVTPSTPNGWLGGLESGANGSVSLGTAPATPPLGSGSINYVLGDTATGASMVEATGLYNGLPLSAITTLTYSTYRVSGGPALAVALQFNVDYDSTDSSVAWQSRLTFEPYYSETVLTGTWQTWDTLTQGRWWSAGTPVVGDAPQAAACTIGSPCTWATVMATYPNISVHATLGAVLLKAGSGWATFEGSADALHIVTNTAIDDTWDFEATDTLVASTDCAADATGLVTIAGGDTPFTVDYALDGIVQATIGPVGVGSQPLLGTPDFTNVYTNIVVTEVGGDGETLNLGDLTCMVYESLNVPNRGEILIGASTPVVPYAAAGQYPLSITLPADYDGNGFDTYIVTDTATVAGDLWFAVFIGNETWVWVPADGVTILR